MSLCILIPSSVSDETSSTAGPALYMRPCHADFVPHFAPMLCPPLPPSLVCNNPRLVMQSLFSSLLRCKPCTLWTLRLYMTGCSLSAQVTESVFTWSFQLVHCVHWASSDAASILLAFLVGSFSKLLSDAASVLLALLVCSFPKLLSDAACVQLVSTWCHVFTELWSLAQDFCPHWCSPCPWSAVH